MRTPTKQEKSDILYRFDRVRIKRDQWHSGEIGTIHQVNRPQYLVTVKGPQPRTNERIWIDRGNLELVGIREI